MMLDDGGRENGVSSGAMNLVENTSNLHLRSTPCLNIRWQIDTGTDIGGSKENQDDCFVWIDPNKRGFVCGVLDGHGRDVGKLAAQLAKSYFEQYFSACYDDMFTHPYETITRAFHGAHQYIKDGFVHALEENGWEITEVPEGFLMKRRKSLQTWQCVHGGTSCSLNILVNDILYSANVGDSDSLFCIESTSTVSSSSLHHIGDAAYDLPFDTSVNYSTGLSIEMRSNVESSSNSSDSPKSDHSGAKKSPPSSPGQSKFTSGMLKNFSWTPTHESTTHGPVTTTGRELHRFQVSDDMTSSDFLLNYCQLRTSHSKASNLIQLSMNRLGSTSLDEPDSNQQSGQSASAPYFLLTTDHSPDCISEYERLRAHHPSPRDGQVPSLYVIYDSPNVEKCRCPAIFDSSLHPFDSQSHDHLLRPTGRGKYYKNVRKEWATLVATPTEARFQDALAFTRSLGDFHLHHYGVSASPEITTLDLNCAFSSSDDSTIACIVLATDGIWDNWTFDTTHQFVMDQTCINAVKSNSNGCRRVVSSFVNRNKTMSKRNFGNEADNATSVLIYLYVDSHIPCQNIVDSGAKL